MTFKIGLHVTQSYDYLLSSFCNFWMQLGIFRGCRIPARGPRLVESKLGVDRKIPIRNSSDGRAWIFRIVIRNFQGSGSANFKVRLAKKFENSKPAKMRRQFLHKIWDLQKTTPNCTVNLIFYNKQHFPPTSKPEQHGKLLPLYEKEKTLWETREDWVELVHGRELPWFVIHGVVVTRRQKAQWWGRARALASSTGRLTLPESDSSWPAWLVRKED